MNKLVFKKVLTAAAASALAVAMLAGCSGGGASKGLEASYNYAEKQVKDYSNNSARISAVFSDKAFSTANAAKMMINAKTTAEDLEAIARVLFLDSITVADENSKVVLSYPKGEEGKSLKEIKEKQTFNRIVKGIVVKTMSDPVKVDGTDEYAVLVGVTGPEDKGAVIVGFKTSEYAAVTGEKLADDCGVNTVALKDGTIISTTMDGVEVGKGLDSLGVKEDDMKNGSFTMTVGDAKYQCKAGTVDNYQFISAEPQ